MFQNMLLIDLRSTFLSSVESEKLSVVMIILIFTLYLLSLQLSPDKLTDLYLEFVKDYPIVSIEDPFDQDDWDAWSKMTAATPIQIVGDDLTVTNPIRIQTAVDKKSCNCLLLKVNQIGSITEAIQA